MNPTDVLLEESFPVRCIGSTDTIYDYSTVRVVILDMRLPLLWASV